MGVGKAESLVDFRVGPELRAPPQLDASGERDVEGFFRLPAAREAVGPFKRRGERRIGFIDRGRLPMHRKAVARTHEMRWRKGRWPRRIVEAIVEAEAKLIE